MSEPVFTQTASQNAAPLRSSGARQLGPWVISIAALALAAYAWLTRGEQVDRVAADAARKLSEAQTATSQAQAASRSAQDLVRDALAKQAVLEAKVAESQGQQVALEKLYEDLSKSRDEWALVEVERVVELAAQQLQVAGNVSGAMAALQTADARLARADKPQYAAVRKIIARDIERLKSAPVADLTGLALKLDALVDQVESLPLLSEPKPPAVASKTDSAKPEQWWQRLSQEVKNELSDLVQIRKVQSADALLLSAEQGRLFRDGLRLRLLSARLALLSRNQSALRNDLNRIEQAVGSGADVKAKATQGFLASVKKMQNAAVQLELPNLNDTLAAMASARSAKAK
jgi:uroporphyrin-3 C-methyltransferase/uroporphyrinogen III methyltransferase/synthase